MNPNTMMRWRRVNGADPGPARQSVGSARLHAPARVSPLPGQARQALLLPGLLALLALPLWPRVSAAEPWTLERAIGFALTNSPDARIAQQRIVAARAGIEQANAALWPRVQFQSAYTRTDNPMFSFGNILNQRAFSPSLAFNDVPDTDNFNLRGLVTQPIYAGGRIRAGRDAAQATSAAARAHADAVRNTLGFEVARAFHTILKAREFIRAAEAGVRSFEGNSAIASNRVETGTALRTEYLDMQVRLAQAREDLVRARNGLKLAERALQNVLGLEESGFAFVVADHAPSVPLPETNDRARRPELAVVEQGQRVAEARVRQARAGYQPRVSAFGSVDHDQGWVTDGDGQSYSAGVLLQWDLWDGRLTRGRVTEAQAELDVLREEERKLRLAIGFEIEQAQLQLQEAHERLAVTEAAAGQAQESADLTRVRFEQGLVTATQLIDAETALIGARVRRAEAAADQRIAIAALRRALGMAQLDSVP